MTQLSADRYFTQIRDSTAAIAALVAGCDPALPIPTCPEWTLRHLATHVGRAHRWAAAITATRSADFIPFREVPDGRLPDAAADRAAWLTAGAERVIGAVGEAGAAPVWAFGTQQPAVFWGRRMCHETLVHAADAQLAAGQPPDLPADVAADTIDEWLTFISGPVLGRPDPRAAGLPPGRTLRVQATDPGLAGPARWRVSHQPGGVRAEREPGPGETGPAAPGSAQPRSGATADSAADLTLSGPAAGLLLLLTRRVSVAEATAAPDPVTIAGDQALLPQWLAETIF
jgi:uncharacterized protein (TIGR03083 family)